MTFRAIAGWLSVAFVIWWVIERPAGAAHLVHDTGVFLTGAAHGMSGFFAKI